MADEYEKFLSKRRITPPRENSGGDDVDYSVAEVLDDEFGKLGYSPTARLSILGDVGRENNWKRKVIFGGHADPKNKALNRGIISWQGDRRAALDSFLRKEGVLGKGDDDELRAMARFMDHEMKNTPEFAPAYNRLRTAASTYDASEALRQYIKYVPEAPYNSYDKEFRVKNNRDWAEKARARGLAQVPRSLKGFEDLKRDLIGGSKKGKAAIGAPTPTVQEPVAPIDPKAALQREYEQWRTENNLTTPTQRTQADIESEYEAWRAANKLDNTQESVNRFNALLQSENERRNAEAQAEVDRFNTERAMRLQRDASIAELGRVAESSAKGELSPDAAYREFIEKNNLPHEQASVDKFNADVERRNAEAQAQAPQQQAVMVPVARQKTPLEIIQTGPGQVVEQVPAEVPVEASQQPATHQPGEAVAGEPTIVDDGSGAERGFQGSVSFRDKPYGASNEEWALQQLVPEIANSLGLPSKDVETVLRRRRIVTADGSRLEDYPRHAVAPFELSKDFYDDVVAEGEDKRNKLAGLIASGVPVDDRPAVANQLGIDPQEVEEAFKGEGDPRYGDAAQQGAIERQRYDQLLSGYRETLGADETEYIADLRARAKMGWMDPDKAEQEIAAEKDLSTRLRQEYKDAWSTRLQQTLASGYMAGRYGSTLTHAMSSANLDRLSAKYVDDILEKYGSLSKYKQEQDAMRAENQGSGKYLNEAARSAGRYLAKIPATILEAGAMATETHPQAIVDSIMGSDLNEQIRRNMMDAAKGYREMVDEDRILGQDKKYKHEFLVNELPEAISQFAVQIIAAPLTGGYSLALPLMEGATAQYRAADEAGAGKLTRVTAGVVGGALAVPDVLIKAKFLRHLMPSEANTFVTRLTDRIFSKFSKLMPEQQARELTKQTVRSFIKNGAKNGTLGFGVEFSQEALEDVGNKALAKATYKPDLTWQDVFVSNEQERRGYFAAGIAGIFGGTVETVTERMSMSELKRGDEAIAYALKQGLINQEIAREFTAAVNREMELRNAGIPSIRNLGKRPLSTDKDVQAFVDRAMSTRAVSPSNERTESAPAAPKGFEDLKQELISGEYETPRPVEKSPEEKPLAENEGEILETIKPKKGHTRITKYRVVDENGAEHLSNTTDRQEAEGYQRRKLPQGRVEPYPSYIRNEFLPEEQREPQSDRSSTKVDNLSPSPAKPRPPVRVQGIQLTDKRGEIADQQPDKATERESYVDQALENLKKTSRTAQGIVDTSASPEKAGQMLVESGERAAELATKNYEDAFGYIESIVAPDDKRGLAFKEPFDVRSIVDKIASKVNKGIVKSPHLKREHDSEKFSYTRAANLDAAYDQFVSEMHRRLSDQNADPIETAAWIEWRANITDHFWTDGVGKISKALAAIPLIRAGLPLPKYRDNKEMYALAPKEPIEAKGKTGQAYLGREWLDFLRYYRSLFDKPEPSIEDAQKGIDVLINRTAERVLDQPKAAPTRRLSEREYKQKLKTAEKELKAALVNNEFAYENAINEPRRLDEAEKRLTAARDAVAAIREQDPNREIATKPKADFFTEVDVFPGVEGKQKTPDEEPLTYEDEKSLAKFEEQAATEFEEDFEKLLGFTDELEDIAKSIGAEFGDVGNLKKVVDEPAATVDPAKYDRLKPQFEKAQVYFEKRAKGDERPMFMLLQTLHKQFDMSAETIRNLKPYIVRFIAEQKSAPPKVGSDGSFTLVNNGLTAKTWPQKLTGRLADLQSATIARVFADPQGFIDRYLKQFPNESNADNAKLLFDEYLADPLGNNSAVHAASSLVNRLAFLTSLKALPKGSRILVIAGGAASGKTTAVRTVKAEADMVVDTVAGDIKGNKWLIDSIVDAGHVPGLFYVWLNPMHAARLMVKRWLTERRIVPLSIFTEGHFDANNAVRETYDYLLDRIKADKRPMDEFLPGRNDYITLVRKEIDFENNTSKTEPFSIAELSSLAYIDKGDLQRQIEAAAYAEYEENRDVYTDDRIADALAGRDIAESSQYPHHSVQLEPDSRRGRGTDQRRVDGAVEFDRESQAEVADESIISAEAKQEDASFDSTQNDRDRRGSDEVESTADVRGAKDVGRTREGDQAASDSGPRNLPSDQAGRDERSRDVEKAGSGEDARSVRSGSKGTRDGDRSSDGVPEQRVRRDYIAPIGSLTREGSWKQAAQNNLDAIELAKQIEEENRVATPEEQARLVKFVGWGASELANNIFKDPDGYSIKEEWKPLARRLRQVMTPEEIETAERSTQYAHYTSEKVIRGIWSAIEQFGFQQGSILEPGMGTGLFAVAAPKNLIENSHYTGIEMDAMTARIAKLLLPDQAAIENDFIKQKLPKNHFDVAIGNPPFARTKILADREYRKHQFSLHDYFFAKSMDSVRPGGLMVFVTSRYTMDRKGDAARQYLSERADLLGAIRLPQTAFKQNAGTEVVTDVLFFRKRMKDEEPAGEAWLGHAEVTAANKYGEEHTDLINEYFAAHPEMVLGEHSFAGEMRHGDNEYTVLPKEGDIEQHFEEAIKNLPRGVFAQQGKSDETRAKVAERDWSPAVKKEGSLYVKNGKLLIREGGSGVELTSQTRLSKADEQWLTDYVGLRDALKQAQYDQLHAEKEGRDWEGSLAALNKVYDAFVKKNGHILAFTERERTKTDDDGNEITTVSRSFKNEKRLSNDIESALVWTLEKITDDGEIVKSSWLKQRTIKPPEPPKIESTEDALMVSLDTLGRLDPGHIAELMAPIRKMTAEDVISELGDLVYEEPGGGWIMADEYLSGNVKDKLEVAEAAASDPRFRRNVEALQKVQPLPLPPERITVQIGATWVPQDFVSQFASEVLKIPTPKKRSYYDEDPGPIVSFDAITHKWKVAGASGTGSQSRRNASKEWGTADRSPEEILEAALNSETVTITYEDPGPPRRKVTDKDAIAAVRAKIEKMNQAFKPWLFSEPGRAKELTDLYNRKMNVMAEREFDGRHLTTPGLSVKFKLHPHVKRAVWRIIQTGSTYLAHAVGAGKTMEMVVSAMEQKRLGLISKPMFIVPNHTLKQFSSEFLDAYPLANIMVADEQNFHTDNRRRFVAQAALNDLDAVILTHSAFGLLRSNEESARAVLDDMLSEMDDAIKQLTTGTDKHGNPVGATLADTSTIKRIQQRMEAIEQKFFGRMDANRDNVLDFEELGVDFLYVDEAHEFRKLDFTTNQTNLKGVDPKGSMRALDLLVKSRWLDRQRPGRSMVLASGTPITNTMAELYSIQRFLGYKDLREDGLEHFDAWATEFGEVEENIEPNAAGQYKPVKRFSKFVNTGVLMQRVRKFMDVLTLTQLADLIKVPTVKLNSKGVHAPEVVIGTATEDLDKYLKGELSNRIEASEEWKPSFEQKYNPDPMIAIIQDGQLAAFDMRFINPRLPNDPGSKLNMMIDGILDSYHKYNNIEYINKETGAPYPIKGASHIVFSYGGFGEQVAANRGFDAKKWMRTRLIEGGIPANEIAFISDYTTSSARQSLFKEVREGKKKILVGSPKNMGTGVNAQLRLKTLHYGMAPWFPADVEQPHGRIIRQGNLNDEVELYWYATKGTYDEAQWAMLSRKSKNIEDVMTGKFDGDIEDVSESSQYAMASALASGDPRALRLAELRGQVEKFTRLEQAYHSTQRRLEYELRSLSSEWWGIPRREKDIAIFESAIALAPNGINKETFSLRIGNEVFDKAADKNQAEIGTVLKGAWAKAVKANKAKAIAQAKDRNQEPIEVEIAKLQDKFPISVRIRGGSYGIESTLTIDIGDEYSVDLTDHLVLENGIADISESGLITRINNAINNIPQKKKEVERELAEMQRQRADIEETLAKPFEYAEELASARAEANDLALEMTGAGLKLPPAGITVQQLRDIWDAYKIDVAKKAIEKGTQTQTEQFEGQEVEPFGLKSVVDASDGVQLYRGQQRGQTGNWWSASREFAQAFADAVPGRRKKDSNGEVLERRLTDEIVFDFPYRVTEYARISEKSADLFGVSEEQFREAIGARYGDSDILRIHVLLGQPGIQDLLRSQGYDFVRAKEELKPGEDVDVYLDLGNKQVGGNNASVLKDENGRPLKLYHGTPAGAIDELKTPAYFTDKPDVADGYTMHRSLWLSPSESGAVYPVYLALENPLEIDAMGTRNDNIPVPWQEWKPKVFGNLPKNAVKLGDLIEYAKEHGHDGVIVRNVIDTADVTDRTKSNVYIAFEASQIIPAVGTDPNSLARTIDEEQEEADRITIEEMRDLQYVPFDDLLSRNPQAELVGVHIKADTASHEIYRRAFEEAKITQGVMKLGSKKAEDLFSGQFMEPEFVELTAEVLLKKWTEAKEKNYPAEQVAILRQFADLLNEAAAYNKGTAIVYVFDHALPHELFHQADYMGAAEKTILNRHGETYKDILDNHVVTNRLWAKHFSQFATYNRQKSLKVQRALLRAEIPPLLLELSDKQLKERFGLTPDERADYLLYWFKGYADKNGIDSLDTFDREEFHVQLFIAKAKDAVRETNEARKAGKADEANRRRREQEEQSAGSKARPPSDRGRARGIGEDELGDNSRLASLPATMRRYGLEASDLGYEVFHDPAAQEEAEKLLNEFGVEGAMKFLRNMPAEEQDVQHALLSFMVQRILLDYGNSLAATNPAEAAKQRQKALNFGMEHSMRAVKAGRFTRAPQLIGQTVEGILYSIQNIVKDTYGNDKSLSPEKWDELEAKARRIEELLAKSQALKIESKQKDREIKKLKEQLAGNRAAKRPDASLARRKKLVERVQKKHKPEDFEKLREQLKERFKPAQSLASVLPSGDWTPVQARLVEFFGQRAQRRITEFEEVFTEDEADELERSGLIKFIRGTPPFMVQRGWSRFWDNNPQPPNHLASAIEPEPFPIDDFAEVGAFILTNGLVSGREYLPKDFRAEMIGEFGDSIEEHFDEIYRKAWELREKWLHDARVDQTRERIRKQEKNADLEDWEIDEILGERKDVARRRRAIEKMHQLVSRGRSKTTKLRAIEDIIAEISPTDEIAVAAAMQARGTAPEEIYKRLEQLGVERPSKQREIYREAKAVREKADRQFKADSDKIAQEIAEKEKAKQDIDDLRHATRTEWKRENDAVAEELRRIKQGDVRFLLGQVYDATNAFRTLMASFDLSAALRQGGFFTFAHPELQADAFDAMRKSFTERGFGRTMMDIEAMPRFRQSRRMGVDYAFAGKLDDTFRGEELFRGRDWIKKVPALGWAVDKGITGWSERTYTAFLDMQRAVMYDFFASELEAMGLTTVNNKAAFEKIAQFVNIATGRGTLPKSKWGRLIMELPFFAPRYTLSRIQLLNITLNPVAYYNMPPGARLVIGTSVARYHATAWSIFMIAAAAGLTSIDPDDDDFLKIKVGNTRYDIWSGQLQPAKLFTKLAVAYSRGNRVPGEMRDSMGKALERFFRGKLSPIASLTWDYLAGEDYLGREFKWTNAVGSRLVPLTIADAVEAYKLDGVKGVLKSTPFTIFGIGVQNYKDRPEQPKTEAEKLAAKIMAMRIEAANLPPQTEEGRQKQEIVANLTYASRVGVEIPESELDDMVKNGFVTPDQKRNILAARNKTYLQDKAEHLTINEFEAVLKEATPEELEKLRPLGSKKLKEARIGGKLDAAQKERFGKLGIGVVGDVAMPDAVKKEFEKLGINEPDVGESLTLRKRGPQTKLTFEQYDKYRRETLERIYGRVGDLIKTDTYQKADEQTKDLLIQRMIRKAREQEQRETKRELLTQ